MMNTPPPSRVLAPGPRETLRGLGDLVRIEAAIAAQAAAGVVIDHDVAHRPVTLGLDDQAAVELQAGADQGGQGAGLAQQVGHGIGIGVPRQHLVDGRAEADDATTHGQAFDLKRGNDVVEDAGVGSDFGHGEAR
jgi:hypothetical protein